MSKKFVLFDFDGVIVDSFDAAYQTSVEMTDHELPKALYLSFFEGNIYKELSEKQEEQSGQEDRQRHYFEKYVPRLLESGSFPGIIDVLGELHESYTMVIVTSSVNAPVERYVKLHDIEKHFDWILGADIHRSKEVKIQMVFDKYGIEPSDCVFVTDTLGDMREAHAKHVPSIGVTWGFHERARLEKGDPVQIVDQPSELPQAIQNVFDRAL